MYTRYAWVLQISNMQQSNSVAELDSDDDDDSTQLSCQASKALAEFYSERDLQEQRLQSLKVVEVGASKDARLSMAAFGEDWNVSQFWYSDETATTLAKRLLDGATDKSWIAVVSAPSVFIQLKKLLASSESSTCPQLRLLEFDRRFDVFTEYVPYDYSHPLRLPPELQGRFDRVICDPPFLSADCQTKAAVTVRWLSKASSVRSANSTTASDEQGSDVRLVVCTGETMRALVARLYVGIQRTTFEPQHAQGRLSNEFRCYANFECEAWSWKAHDDQDKTE